MNYLEIITFLHLFAAELVGLDWLNLRKSMQTREKPEQ